MWITQTYTAQSQMCNIGLDTIITFNIHLIYIFQNLRLRKCIQIQHTSSGQNFHRPSKVQDGFIKRSHSFDQN